MNTEINIHHELSAELIQLVGSDSMIAKAARVSTKGSHSEDDGDYSGLINFLMKNRHGSPFEHNLFTFRVGAPIFVWREIMRHRIGFSYNEQSGRYMELTPDFYIPGSDRAIVQVGKPGSYEFTTGDGFQEATVVYATYNSSKSSYEKYIRMLDAGVAREVARMVLPVNIMSWGYITCNTRSLMSFLSLRTKHEDATYPSYPQREIEMVAESMEAHFKALYPVTHEAFNKYGRVSP